MNTTSATLYASTFSTSFGAFSVATDETGAIVATAFGDLDRLRQRIRNESDLAEDDERTTEGREQLRDYFQGKRRSFSVRLAPIGSSFQQRVWRRLCEIPVGQTTSYGQLARDLKSSPRAVGRANATNPICVIVPCHRVVGTDGSLTGFAFGEELKRRLLEHEQARLKVRVSADASCLSG